jgi:hypothetical protein
VERLLTSGALLCGAARLWLWWWRWRWAGRNSKKRRKRVKCKKGMEKKKSWAEFGKRFRFNTIHFTFSFFQHSLTFYITSITIYYYSNKKITTKQKKLFFQTKHSYFFTFSKKYIYILTFSLLKKKNIHSFFTSINFCYNIKPLKPQNPLPNGLLASLREPPPNTNHLANIS